MYGFCMPDIPSDSRVVLPSPSLAGAQPKLAVLRTADGRYVQGITEEEVERRFDVCSDLVDQLVRYCEKKRHERPDWELDLLLRKVAQAVRSKGWDISTEEIEWVLGRVRDRMTQQQP